MLKILKESVHKDLKEIRKWYVTIWDYQPEDRSYKKNHKGENTITKLKNKITRVVNRRLKQAKDRISKLDHKSF